MMSMIIIAILILFTVVMVAIISSVAIMIDIIMIMIIIYSVVHVTSVACIDTTVYRNRSGSSGAGSATYVIISATTDTV